jgi:hypothetical protein
MIRQYFKRHFPVILLAVSLFGLGIFTLYWFAQMRHFQVEMAQIEAGSSKVFAVQARQVSYSGFPYRLKAQFDDVQLVRQRADYTITMETPRLELTRLMWSPQHMIFIADQPKVAMRSRGGTHPVKLEWSADSLQSSLRMAGHKIERLSFEFSNVLWTDGHMLALPISMADMQIHLRESSAPSANGKLDKNRPVFANLRVMAGGVRSGDAAAMNIDMFADLTGGTGLDDSAPALDAWRQRGGTVELRRFDVVRPGLLWSANGQIALDSTGAIMGAGRLRTNAAEPAISLLKGQISVATTTSQAQNIKWHIAKNVIGFDSAPVVTLPFQLFDVVK